MTDTRRANTRTAVMLMEVIVVLALGSLVATLTVWGMTLQFHTQKRLAAQTHRQFAMRAVLHHLRRDLAVATGIEWRQEDDPLQTPSASNESVSVRIHTSAGVVTYAILNAATGDTETAASLEATGRTLVRTDADGAVKTWDMHGQIVAIEPDSRRPAQLLRIRFESIMKYKTGHHKIRRFQTTIAAGFPS
ncbi:MAG: hypothetical protein O7F76_11165 [Planctomycetota bacterium]|nr:hypothetical protein [Planctomycetota bacterium]